MLDDLTIIKMTAYFTNLYQWFQSHWSLGLLLQKNGGHGIFNTHNDRGAFCAHEGETGANCEQILTGYN